MRHLGIVLFAMVLSACGAGDFQQSVSSAGIGAENYTPSVYIEPGNEIRYKKVLGICRKAAANRQLTAAQTAALRAETGVADAAVQGAIGGMVEDVISGADSPTGMIMGLLGSAAGAAMSESSRGTVATAAATRAALLNCLRATSRGSVLWKVLE